MAVFSPSRFVILVLGRPLMISVSSVLCEMTSVGTMLCAVISCGLSVMSGDDQTRPAGVCG